MNNIALVKENLRIIEKGRFSWWLRDVIQSTYFSHSFSFGNATRDDTSWNNSYVTLKAFHIMTLLENNIENRNTSCLNHYILE